MSARWRHPVLAFFVIAAVAAVLWRWRARESADDWPARPPDVDVTIAPEGRHFYLFEVPRGERDRGDVTLFVDVVAGRAAVVELFAEADWHDDPAHRGRPRELFVVAREGRKTLPRRLPAGRYRVTLMISSGDRRAPADVTTTRVRLWVEDAARSPTCFNLPSRVRHAGATTLATGTTTPLALCAALVVAMACVPSIMLTGGSTGVRYRHAGRGRAP